MATKKDKEPINNEYVPPEENNEYREDENEDDEKQEEGEEVKAEHDEIIFKDPYLLKPHKINKKIYGDKIDEDLVASIRDVGQLEPVVIGPKHVILSGHRRWLAICAIKDRETDSEKAEKIKVLCIFKDIKDPIEQKIALLEYNRQRKKNYIQIYHEAVVLKEIYSEKAKYRMYSGQAQDPSPNSDEGIDDEKGRTDKKLEAYTGIGKTQLNTLFKIGDRYYRPEQKDNNPLFRKNINEIMRELKAGALTINAAEKKLDVLDASVDESIPQAERETAKSLIKEMKEGKVTPNRAGDILETFRKKEKEEKLPKTKKVTTLPEGVGDVFVVDPQGEIDLIQNKAEKGQINIEKLVVRAEDAAIFIWANSKSIDYLLNTFQFWGFHKKAIAVCHTKKEGGTWFTGDVEFLLFGIKGDMPRPAEDVIFPIVFECDKEHRLEFVYEMAEKMFPGRSYCTPFSQSNRKGWLQPDVSEVEDNDVDLSDLFNGARNQ